MWALHYFTKLKHDRSNASFALIAPGNSPMAMAVWQIQMYAHVKTTVFYR